MSAYTSIREVARHKVGRWLSTLLKERFENVKVIKNTKCPTMIIHGQKDTLIPIQ